MFWGSWKSDVFLEQKAGYTLDVPSGIAKEKDEIRESSRTPLRKEKIAGSMEKESYRLYEIQLEIRRRRRNPLGQLVAI